MSNVRCLQTAFAGNDNHHSGYAEVQPISHEALGVEMHDMYVATARFDKTPFAVINSDSLSGAFFRNQDGGGYREMQPICEIGHAAAMTEMYVTTIRARTANEGLDLKAVIA